MNTAPFAPYLLTDDDRQTLIQRRQALAAQVPSRVLLWAGGVLPRNFPANGFPFRASSHFLYFAGVPLVQGVILLEGGTMTLFWDEPPPSATLWHGETPSRSDWAAYMACDRHYPLADLPQWVEAAAPPASLPVQDPRTQAQQQQILGHLPLDPPRPEDVQLAEAVIQLRMHQDALALGQLHQAMAVTLTAHLAGMASTFQALHQGGTEARVRSVMEAVIQCHHMETAYGSIVTTQGQILHHHHSHHPLQAGDLLLADVGAETPLGWAADITRTWPVAGRFSPTQRDLYGVVLAAHDQAIAALAPGVEYRDVHLRGCEVLAAGLVDLGILRGNPADLVAEDAHALFFPHGIGHLLGLDVHDMEDLGDRAGYAPDRTRSDRFGLGYLRLDRPLEAGMVVTIEPGFYQVPALLQDPQRRDRYRDQVNWERLEQFGDVLGIRIEDDVLITATGSQVLTAALPTGIPEIESIVGG